MKIQRRQREHQTSHRFNVHSPVSFFATPVQLWCGMDKFSVYLTTGKAGKVNLCLNSATTPSLWLQPKCSFFWVTRRHEINARISLGLKGYFSATFSLASQLSENEVPSITIKQQKEYFKSDTQGNQQVFVWGPIHTYPFLFHFIHIFFPRIGLPSTRSWWKRIPKTLSRSEMSENKGL